MLHTRLLVFSTVYLIKSFFLGWIISSTVFSIVSLTVLLTIQIASASTNTTANTKLYPEPTTTGFCYEIYTGSELIGSTLELKRSEDNLNSTISFTTTQTKSKIPESQKQGFVFGSDLNVKSASATAFQITRSESDQYFVPIKSIHETYRKNKIIRSRTSSFETLKDSISISTKDQKQNKAIKRNEAKGLVLSQHMMDLLFARKKITDINPKEKLVFQTFSESEGETHQVTTELEGESDHLILIHQVEGSIYKTTHASDGRLIGSHDLTKNIKTKPCTSTSVLTHLNSALSFKQFKSLFSFEDREKIKKCCQHF